MCPTPYPWFPCQLSYSGAAAYYSLSQWNVDTLQQAYMLHMSMIQWWTLYTAHTEMCATQCVTCSGRYPAHSHPMCPTHLMMTFHWTASVIITLFNKILLLSLTVIVTAGKVTQWMTLLWHCVICWLSGVKCYTTPHSALNGTTVYNTNTCTHCVHLTPLCTLLLNSALHHLGPSVPTLQENN